MITTPQLTDDLILSNVRRRLGPAVNDNTPLIAAHAKKQFGDRANAELLGMNTRLQKMMFDKTMGMKRRALKDQKKLDRVSNLISLGGLGLGYFEKKKEDKRLAAETAQRQEYNDAIQNLIKTQMDAINRYKG